MQDYEKTGKFLAWPPAAAEEEVLEEGGSLSVRKALPSWLLSRTFRNSAFESLTSSHRSDDSIDRLNASLAAGMVSSPIGFKAEQDLLTGEGAVSRCFT